VFIAESPNVIERAIRGGYKPLVALAQNGVVSTDVERIFDKYPELPVYVAEEAVLKELTGFPMSRGLLCVMARRQIASQKSVCRDAKRVVILENVVNPTNVGAIFRSAAALNMDAVLLTAGCSDPLYRRAARVSMGTVFQIPWAYMERKDKADECSAAYGIEQLKAEGFKVVAMALKDDSLSMEDPALQGIDKLAIVMGTEGEGLMDDTICACDHTVKIPMSHGVDSLNVAAASAVAFWQLRRDKL